MFQLIKKDKDTQARVGVITTEHGEIHTPSYVMVATRGSVKTLNPAEVHKTKTQVLIANTFHLWQEEFESVKKAGGLHQCFGWEKMPLMTDSGGFQVFSYGFSREHDIGKIGMFPDEHAKRHVRRREYKDKNEVTILEEGVIFAPRDVNGIVMKKIALTPQKSIEIQRELGADIIFAFDECTSPFHNYDYTKQSLERTHNWAKICLDANRRSYQKLYGIVQGGAFQDLRERSARYINSLSFDGYGIGGTLGDTKLDMAHVLEWTTPLLSEEKPRHLLGIGEIGDVLESIERGIDTFDCVIPTREARHGSIWTAGGRYDVRKAKYRKREPLEDGCFCEACRTVTRMELSEMFHDKNQNAGRLATIHNVSFFNTLMENARKAILEERFFEYKKEILQRYQKNSL